MPREDGYLYANEQWDRPLTGLANGLIGFYGPLGRFARVSLASAGFYGLCGFRTRFSRAFLIDLDRVSLGFPSISPRCTRSSWIALGFTGFYWVLLGFTGFHWVLLDFIGLY